jgi:hypothetical protein
MKRALSKQQKRAIRALPRGFFLPCGFALAPGRSKPRRALCERKGLLYEVRGDLAAVSVVLCPRHRDRLLKTGHEISLAPPLEQSRERMIRKILIVKAAILGRTA